MRLAITTSGFAFLGILSFVDSMEVKVFKQGVGKNAVEMVDETQFKNPEVVTNFDDEIRKKVDFNDEYDELVPKLPKYIVHKFNKNIGYTMVPIVTREKPYWSTPMPRILLEKTWSTPDVLRSKTKPFKGLKATTPMPAKPIDEELLPPDNEQPKKHRLSNINRRPTSNGKFSSGNTNGSDDQPQIQFASPQPHRPNAFRRITVSTTSPRPTTQLPSKRTHPVWHNPNFIPTRKPLAVVESTTSSPLIQQQNNKWQPWWKRNGNNHREAKVLQVSSMLEASENKREKEVRHPVKSTSEFTSEDGRHVVSTANDGSPVEIVMAPQTEKPIVVQKPSDSTVRSNQFRLLPGPHRHTSGRNGAWSWRRTWKIGPDGRRVESFTSTGNVPKDRLPTNLSSSSSSTTNEQRVETTPRLTTPSLQRPKCRVLEAENDGTPAADNDSTCKLLYPGYPADNTCKCTFQVNGRDKEGCAIGFLYSCKPVIGFSQ